MQSNKTLLSIYRSRCWRVIHLSTNKIGLAATVSLFCYFLLAVGRVLRYVRLSSALCHAALHIRFSLVPCGRLSCLLPAFDRMLISHSYLLTYSGEVYGDKITHKIQHYRQDEETIVSQSDDKAMATRLKSVSHQQRVYSKATQVEHKSHKASVDVIVTPQSTVGYTSVA